MKTHRLLFLAVSMLGLWTASGFQSFAGPGDVDLSFNPGLRVNDYVYAVAAQPDGKVVIGGLFTSPGTLLARLNTNGSVDTNFNAGAGANGVIYSMAVQPDGKIVLGGAFSRINGVSRNRIARLNSDGSLDLTFDPGTGTDGRIRSVALHNGKVLIAGDFYEVNQLPRTRIARLNANGSVDDSFNPGSGADQEVYSIVAQPDGRILVGGYFLNVNDVARSFIARLNSNGTLDDSFDPGAGPDYDVDSMALQTDGKIVIGGGFQSVNGYSRGRVARLHGDGSVDESFDPGMGADFHVSAVVVQTNGSIVVGGNFGSFNGVPRSNIVRLATDGSVDDSFDPGNGTDGGVYSVALLAGKVFVGGAFRIFNGVTRNYIMRLEANGSLDPGFEPNSGADYPVLAAAPDASGKVLVGGYFTFIGGVGRNYVARLNADGSLDGGFNPGSGANNRVLCVLALPEGKALIGGLFTSFNGTNRGRIARLNADGNLDLSFNPGSGANGDVLCMARQADGKVLLAGEFTSFNGTNRGRVVRLNSDGSLDTSFNTSTGANLTVRSVLVQPDGKVLLGGDFVSVNGSNLNRIARLNSDGTLDMSFTPGLGANGTVECLALQSDGRIIVGGQFTSLGGASRGRIARLHANGNLDGSFNPNANGIVLSVAVHVDDSVILGGDFFSVSGVSRPHVARLNANGSLDLSFNPGTGANDTVNAVAFQTDGKVLAGGFFNTMNGIGRSCLARLDGDLPRPSLTIRHAGNSTVAFWPVAFTNFILQTTANAAQSNAWMDVPNAPGLAGGQWTVTNTVTAPAAYFRLKSF